MPGELLLKPLRQSEIKQGVLAVILLQARLVI
jgi:hypothetical protein